MKSIYIINFILAIFIIAIGYLVKKNPNLIAGYNTLNKNDKENFNVDLYSQLIKKTLLLTGSTIIVATLFCRIISWNIGELFVTVIPITIAPLYLAIRSKKYYISDYKRSNIKNVSNNNIIISLIFVFTLLITGFALHYASKEPNIILDNKSLIATGMYGFDIPIKDIKAVDITDKISKIEIRTNGLGLGHIMKGYFKLKGIGICKLLLHNSDGPYLKISLINDKTIFLNFENSHKTRTLYKDILKVLKNANQF